MKFIDLWFTLDGNMPIWVNDGEDTVRYESKHDTPDEYDRRYVAYVTLDSNGELTIEL